MKWVGPGAIPMAISVVAAAAVVAKTAANILAASAAIQVLARAANQTRDQSKRRASSNLGLNYRSAGRMTKLVPSANRHEPAIIASRPLS